MTRAEFDPVPLSGETRSSGESGFKSGAAWPIGIGVPTGRPCDADALAMTAVAVGVPVGKLIGCEVAGLASAEPLNGIPAIGTAAIGFDAAGMPIDGKLAMG